MKGKHGGAVAGRGARQSHSRPHTRNGASEGAMLHSHTKCMEVQRCALHTFCIAP